MQNILGKIGSSVTGNIAKAILFVRKVGKNGEETLKQGTKKAEELQKNLLANTSSALKNGVRSKTSFSSLTAKDSILGTDSGFLSLEVQFNPSTLYLETVAGIEIEYEGGDLGARSANQVVQLNHPAATTLSFELIFDEVNTADAFMLENLAPSIGNITTNISSAVHKAAEKDYSVQPQMDGVMSLLTRETTRQIIFFWGKFCFAGELVSVQNRYHMFNRFGNPIRGSIQLSIRQGEGSLYAMGKDYWEEAFSRAFGKAGMDHLSGKKGTFGKATNNNILNLNL